MRVRMYPWSRVAVAAIALCALVACALGMAAIAPQSAHAVGKKTVYVVKSITTTDEGNKYVNSYAYYKNGLVKIEKNESTSGGSKDPTLAFTYKYKNRKLTGMTQKYGSSIGRYTVKTNKKGWVTKCIQGSFVEKYKYNSKGQLTKFTNPYAGTMRYSYNSNGYVKTLKADGDTTKYIYDNNGQLLKQYFKGSLEYSFVNTYKNGRLVKQVAKNFNGDVSYKKVFKYKKISVPKNAVRMVKSQQHAITTGIPRLESVHK